MCVYNISPIELVLSQVNTVHILTQYLRSILTVLSHRRRISQVVFSLLGFPIKIQYAFNTYAYTKLQGQIRGRASQAAARGTNL
jgi:hypothetical protein